MHPDNSGMRSKSLDPIEALRKHLLERAEAYRGRTGRAFSFVSKEAVNDSKFLGRVREGKNFNTKTYQKVIDWLDDQERQPERLAS